MLRCMRVLVLFDLPMETSKNRRDYTQFRKFLISNGFLMMQKSVYCKLTANDSQAGSVKQMVIENKPPSGVVQLLTITERQYQRIISVVDESKTDVLQTQDRTVIL